MDKDSSKKKVSRRKFIKIAIAAAISLELIYVLFGLVGKKKPKARSKNLFKAGTVNSFLKGKVYPFSSGLFYLSVFEDGSMLALSTRCTHLGCIVQSGNEEGFNCPCHASKFNKYGEVLSPPATRALDIFPIYIEKGEVLVDNQNPIQRNKFKKSQLTYI